MKELRFVPHLTALLLTDVQNVYILPKAPIHIPAAVRMLPKLKALLDKCREAGMLIIYTRQLHTYPGLYGEVRAEDFEAPGVPYMREGAKWSEVHDAVQPRPEEIVLKKYRYSAFFGTPLELILKEHKIDTVIITGIATNVCCDSTARDAFFRDFRVIFTSDCTATFDDVTQQVTLQTMDLLFGTVASSDQIVANIDQALAQVPPSAAGAR